MSISLQIKYSNEKERFYFVESPETVVSLVYANIMWKPFCCCAAAWKSVTPCIDLLITINQQQSEPICDQAIQGNDQSDHDKYKKPWMKHNTQ